MILCKGPKKQHLMLCHTGADSIQPRPGKKSVRRSAVAFRTFQYCRQYARLHVLMSHPIEPGERVGLPQRGGTAHIPVLQGGKRQDSVTGLCESAFGFHAQYVPRSASHKLHASVGREPSTAKLLRPDWSGYCNAVLRQQQFKAERFQHQHCPSGRCIAGWRSTAGLPTSRCAVRQTQLQFMISI